MFPAEEKNAELFLDEAHVYCLQQVGVETRLFLEKLKSKGFQLVHLEKNSEFDAWIALDPTKFTQIQNYSINTQITKDGSKDVAIATADHIDFGQRVAFVSAHAPWI
jgi:hypothetical protein